MAHVKSLKFLILLAAFCVVESSKLIYRRFEKQHPKKNYTQVVEIFETYQKPPPFLENDRALNDFLAKDSFKVDMNCSKANGRNVDDSSEKRTTTRRTYPTIPTTAYRLIVTTPSPNLNNLFTIRTRPTIKGNPRENTNPDYTNLDSKSSEPSVQVTKHPASTEPPTIVIKETDEKKTTLGDIDRDFNKLVTTTLKSKSVEEDEEIFYDEEGSEGLTTIVPETEEEATDEYIAQNYDDDIIPPEEIDPKQDYEYEEENDNDEDDDFDDDEENRKRRRRRQKSKRFLARNTRKL